MANLKLRESKVSIKKKKKVSTFTQLLRNSVEKPYNPIFNNFICLFGLLRVKYSPGE